MASPTKPADVSVCTVAGHQLVPSTSAKCLGHWLSWDLSSVKASMKVLGKRENASLLMVLQVLLMAS